MIRRIDGTFRAESVHGINIYDPLLKTATAAGSSNWTNGCTVLDSVNITTGSPTNDRTAVLGFSVTAFLVLASAANVNAFGKFGRIIAGVTTDIPATPFPSAAILPGLSLQSLPSDLSLVGDLWNPADDPLPPIVSTYPTPSPNSGLQATITQTLPSPIIIPRGGSNLCIGLWMLPSLIASDGAGSPKVTLVSQGAIWSVTYDDGAT